MDVPGFLLFAIEIFKQRCAIKVGKTLNFLYDAKDFAQLSGLFDLHQEENGAVTGPAMT